ncbi:MAG: tetratricopeptide repeat protein [Chitinophagales bacterium]
MHPKKKVSYTSTNNLITYLTEDKQLDKALVLAKQTLKVFRENADTTEYNYGLLLVNFGLYIGSKNQINLAIKYYNQAFDVLEPIVGKDNILYTNHYIILLNFLSKQK